VRPEHRVCQCDECLRPLPGHGREGAGQLVGMPDGAGVQLETQAARSGLNLAQLVWADWIAGIPEDGDAGDVGQGLLEELEPFAT
jgi:hypothetical protein